MYLNCTRVQIPKITIVPDTSYLKNAMDNYSGPYTWGYSAGCCTENTRLTTKLDLFFLGGVQQGIQERLGFDVIIRCLQ